MLRLGVERLAHDDVVDERLRDVDTEQDTDGDDRHLQAERAHELGADPDPP